MSELPRGWVHCSLEELCGSDGPIVYGIIQPGPDIPGGVPYIRPTELIADSIDIANLRTTSKEISEDYNRSRLAEGDIILAIVGTIGKLAIVPKELAGANITQSSARIRPPNWMQPQYLAYALKSPILREQYDKYEFGNAVRRLNVGHVRALQLPLPPLPEQRRIVSKIESLTARSRRAKEALDAIPTLLERFRQSVLASAFRGDLTADWREKHPDVEPAEVLLQRIRAERRKKWEEAELAKMRAKGKAPGDDRWKAKYEEPAPVDTSELPELPEGWAWASVCEIGDVQTGGTPPGKIEGCYGGSIPFYKPTDLDAGIRMDSAREYLTELGATYVPILPPMSVLVTCIGATIGKTGLSSKRCATNQQINAIVTERGIDPVLIYWACVRHWAQDWIRTNSSATTLPILNKGRFERMPIPIAPIEEQQQICRLMAKIEQRVVSFAQIYGHVEASSQLVNSSILAKAFRGELVPQDPNDEPASMLLERIRAEAAKQEGTAKKRTGKKRS